MSVNTFAYREKCLYNMSRYNRMKMLVVTGACSCKREKKRGGGELLFKKKIKKSRKVKEAWSKPVQPQRKVSILSCETQLQSLALRRSWQLNVTVVYYSRICRGRIYRFIAYAIRASWERYKSKKKKRKPIPSIALFKIPPKSDKNKVTDLPKLVGCGPLVVVSWYTSPCCTGYPGYNRSPALPQK